MKMIVKIQYFLYLIFYLANTFIKCQDSPTFRIIAPQNLCQEKDDNSVKNPDGTTISFQPFDGIKLSYKFRIFFKTLGVDNLSQREILLVWKAVRMLEHRLNIDERLDISKQNMVFVNKSEVVPGVNYLFHVTGITDAGETTKEKVFNIKYADGVLQNDHVPEGINILLIGSVIMVSNAEYPLVAKVSFCEPKYNYYLRWRINNLDEEFQELNRIIGSTLSIPANTLVAGTDTLIETRVYDANSSKLLANDSIEVSVAQRGFPLYIIPSYVKIGINSNISFNLYIRNFDNDLDNIQILWDCINANTMEKITSEGPDTHMKFVTSFHTSGRFQIVANVNLHDIEGKVVAEVDIVPIVYVNYDISYIPHLDVAANQPFQLKVLVIDLVSDCNAGWTSAQEDGYKYISEDEIGNDKFGQIHVTDMERMYLSELIDFGNSTVNREVLLDIPSSDEIDAKWKGLQGDVRYKFRLDTVCPMPYTSADQTTIYFISQFEFVLHTNAPPSGGKLKIKPSSGLALKTIFQISSTQAKDLLLDTPISYELCAKIEEYEICFGKYLEYKTWETFLPYTIRPMELYVNICDIRKACNISYARDITVRYADITAEEFELQKEQIQGAFMRTDYKTGHNIIMMFAITYKNANTELFEELKLFVKALIDKEINKLLESPINQYYIPKNDIVEFVTMTKTNLELLHLGDTKTFEQLLEILDQVTFDFGSNEHFVEPVHRDLEIQDRYRRQPSDNYYNNDVQKRLQAIDMAYVQIKLYLIQDILKSKRSSSSTEKLKVLERIDALMEKMCYSDLIVNEYVETPIVTIKLEKNLGNYLLRKQFTFGNNSQSKGKFKISSAYRKNIQEQHTYCVAIAQYNEDYLTNDDTALINIKIYDLVQLKAILDGPTETTKEQQFLHAIELEMPKKHFDENMCALRVGNDWSWKNCKTKNKNSMFVSCACTQLGYFRLISLPDPTATAHVEINTIKSTNAFVHNDNLQTTATIAFPTAFTMVKINTESTMQNALKVSTELTTIHQENVSKPNISNNNNIKNKNNTNNNTNNNNKNTTKELTSSQLSVNNLKKASSVIYIIPLLIIIIAAIISVLFFIYYRRHPRKEKKFTSSLNPQLEVRPRREGIKYGTIYDCHLMQGTF